MNSLLRVIVIVIVVLCAFWLIPMLHAPYPIPLLLEVFVVLVALWQLLLIAGLWPPQRRPPPA